MSDHTFFTGGDFSGAYSSSFSGGSGQEEAPTNTLLYLLKVYLGLDPNDPSQDEQLTRHLNFAGDMCERYVDRVIAKRAVEEYFQSYFGRVTLHNYPIDTEEPVTVLLDGVEETGYKIYQERWRIPHLTRQDVQRDTPLDWRVYEQIVVTYTAGFDPIPSDLAQAIVYVAADLYRSEGTGSLPGGGGGSGDIKSMSIHDVGSITYDVGGQSGSRGGAISSFGLINETAAHLLHRYKRMAA